MFEGQVQKLWSKHLEEKTELTLSEVLRRLADYLEADHSDKKFHGEIVADLKKAVKKWTEKTIIRNAYLNFGIVIDEDISKTEMVTIYVAEFVRRLEESYLYERKVESVLRDE